MLDNQIDLDGVWEFLHIADDRLTGPAEVRQIVVPSPWQAHFHDLRMRAGIGIYRRTVHVPADWLHDTISIRFGAVFHNTKVFINDQPVGSNEGGFRPFSFDVTAYLKPGRNEIKVRVDSPTDNPAEFPDSPFAEIPFGKQSWYGPLSGIWQSVYLRAALDQDYYPDTICTVPSIAFLEDQFRKAKELGLNCLRCHIKAADPRYYEVADRIGMLIWTELPNGGMATDRSRGRKEKLLKGIVDRDLNHPSIIIWTIINEN